MIVEPVTTNALSTCILHFYPAFFTKVFLSCHASQSSSDYIQCNRQILDEWILYAILFRWSFDNHNIQVQSSSSMSYVPPKTEMLPTVCWLFFRIFCFRIETSWLAIFTNLLSIPRFHHLPTCLSKHLPHTSFAVPFCISAYGGSVRFS